MNKTNVFAVDPFQKNKQSENKLQWKDQSENTPLKNAQKHNRNGTKTRRTERPEAAGSQSQALTKSQKKKKNK